MRRVRGTLRYIRGSGSQTSLRIWDKLAAMTRSLVEAGSVVIRRRNIVQDAVRSYAVFIDGVIVGKIWAFQTKVFTVVPGPHELQLKIINTGKSCSAVFKIDVNSGSRLVFRTHARGLKNILMLPFALRAGAEALAKDEKLQSKRYEWPWIRMRLED
jgi:hypothetical protein